MSKQEKIREGIGKITKKWYAPGSPHSEDGYGESCEHEIMVYLYKKDVVIRTGGGLPKCILSRIAVKPSPFSDKLEMPNCPVEKASYVKVEPLIKEVPNG